MHGVQERGKWLSVAASPAHHPCEHPSVGYCGSLRAGRFSATSEAKLAISPLPREGKPIQQGYVVSETGQEKEKKPDLVAQGLLGLSHGVLVIDKALQRLCFISLKTSWLQPAL